MFAKLEIPPTSHSRHRLADALRSVLPPRAILRASMVLLMCGWAVAEVHTTSPWAHSAETKESPSAAVPGRSNRLDVRNSTLDRVAQRKVTPGTSQAGNQTLRSATTTAVTVDAARLRDAGIRVLKGTHLILLTDVPVSAAVRELPRVFDAACPLWADYFKIDRQRYDHWRVTGCLMQDRSRFQHVGLLDQDGPKFLHGYAENGMLWWNEQPTAYYRRHLILHEGVHSFMQSMLGGSGAVWYREGMAELLATHRWDGKKLEVGRFPESRREVPMLGRIKLVQDAAGEGRALSVKQVMSIVPRDFEKNEAYAWCWALTAFLDGHPAYRQRFRGLSANVRKPDFTARLVAAYRDDWRELNDEWRFYAANLEHGYDFNRTVIRFTHAPPLPRDGKQVTIRADRGWQNTGTMLIAGVTYEISASGRYQVARQPRVWWSEPGGVSIRYYHGRPLGMLLATVYDDRHDDAADRSDTPFDPVPVGLRTEITPKHTGTLMLRINDSAGELDDNAGTLRITIRPAKPRRASE